MAKLIYVDNSNVFIEGQRVAAIENGFALTIDDAMRTGTLDYTYRLDFGKLYEFVSKNGDRDVKRAMLFGSRPPPNDSLWEIAKSAGFEPVIEDRNQSNREKKIDTGIVAAMVEHSYELADQAKDRFVLVAGDGDYVPAVKRLVNRGFTVDVLFWEHASRELKQVCSNFVAMDSHFQKLSR